MPNLRMHLPCAIAALTALPLACGGAPPHHAASPRAPDAQRTIAATSGPTSAVPRPPDAISSPHAIACAPASPGWRAMSSESSVSAGVDFQVGVAPVWDGDEALYLGTALPRGCEGASCGRTGEAAAYDPIRDRWRLLDAPTALPRHGTRAAWTGERWILYGFGVGVSLDPKASAGDAKWTTLPAAPLSQRFDESVVWMPTTGELLVWGGGGYEDGTTKGRSDGAAYRPSTGTWRTIAASPLSPRGRAMAVWNGHSVVIAFGMEEDSSSGASSTASTKLARGAAEYDPQADVWRPLPDPGVAPRTSELSLTTDDASTRAVFELDASTTVGGDPTRTAYASFVARGKLYVWGGRTGDAGSIAYVGDGMSFDEATSTWSAMPTNGPSARAAATALFTGCDAIIYGGLARDARGEDAPVDDGMLFRP